MDDPFRRLRTIAAIAALGAGGVHAQDAEVSRWPRALPSVGTPSGSGVRLGLPVEKQSLQGEPRATERSAVQVPMAQRVPRSQPPWRGRLASQTLRGDERQEEELTRAAPPRSPSESMTAVQWLRRSDQLVHDAEMALRRGAVHSSRESAIAALRASAAAVAMGTGEREATAALEQALTALREAGDFVGRYGHVDDDDLQRMVEAHQTRVLKGTDAAQLSPQAAADLYLDFARQRLTRAADGRREAAAALALLARAERMHHDVHAELSESVAITLMRAAVGTDPTSSQLANELGYQAMRLGLLDEAQWALERSWAMEPNEPALRNLIETHRLAGDIEGARRLVAMLPQFSAAAKAELPEVTQVDPASFAAISPPVQPPAAPSLGGVARAAAAPSPPAGVQRPDPPRGAVERARDAGAVPGEVADAPSGVLGRMAGVMRRVWQ